ncbi:hypothetical protein [Dictyobacter formicarum]|uniref:Glycosyltransferase RgtA/B/C/D-like domain-containing protein n=1 Tax=Dictyobacter formicarum TaxID=2778368 RepID=A0ABQ3VIH7_9CHLR|nr:hypothetical protein [Dictyobacter formicarum]GHO85590.1 hypothetical protein KSZ_35960 [Dictyobacter formicarum]
MHEFLQRRLHDCIFFAILMVLLGGLAVLLYIDPTYPSNAEHFILQAQAWLHGHLDIGVHLNDTVIINGKVYIVYPPLPALMMVPFVAVLGDKFSDVWFTWVFASLNIILLFRTLEVMRVRCITNRTPIENLIIAITFGFGTIALWLCLGGRIWFTAQTISVFGIMFTLHSTLSRRWPLATLGVGMVMLTRVPEALIGIVPLVVYLHDLGIGRRVQQQWHFLPRRWPSIHELAITLTPFVIALLIHLVHNQLYFGNPLSIAYDIQNQQNYTAIKYGVVSWHYIWPNFVVDFLRWPSFSYTDLFDLNPQLNLFIDGIGTSMFFSTPLLAIFIFAPQGKTPQTWLRTTFWVTTAIMLLTVLVYCTTGWIQVGARYVCALYPLLFLLLAQRAAPLDTRWISLAGMSIFSNLLLAQRFWQGKSSIEFIAGSAGIVLVACLVAIIMLRRQEHQHEEIAPLVPAMISVGSAYSSKSPPQRAVPKQERVMPYQPGEHNPQ